MNLLHEIHASGAFEAVDELERIEPGWTPATLTRDEAELLPRPIVALVHLDGRRAVLARMPAANGPSYGVYVRAGGA